MITDIKTYKTTEFSLKNLFFIANIFSVMLSKIVYIYFLKLFQFLFEALKTSQ